MIPIGTDRLVLRPFVETDGPWVLDVWSRPEVTAWMSDDFDKPDLAGDLTDALAKIAKWRTRFDDPPRGYWAVVPRDEEQPVAAVCLLTVPNDENGEVEIGWWQHPDSAGHGYVTEAATAVLEHGFAGGLREIWAVMYPDNTPSAAVARRLGMSEVEDREVPWYPGPTRLFRIEA